MTEQDYRQLSFWHDSLVASGVDDLRPRPRLSGDTEVDVAIVGAGFTGLWTAYYLLREDPRRRVLLIEAEIAGFGASGRNGGWCSALFPTSVSALAGRHGRDAALALRRAMNATVAEVGRVARAERIDCDWAQGGTVELARTALQLARARDVVRTDEQFDRVDDLQLLPAPLATRRVGAAGVLGAIYTPHCARIHPGKLVRGLARAVERRGGTIVEQTRAQAVQPGLVRTPRGIVRARHVIRATEAWTATLPSSHREVAPVYSLMVATEPLPQPFWDVAGLAAGETFNDLRHLIIYGQRTADDRLAFGGRGAPYHFGSAIRSGYDADERVFRLLRQTLAGMFPGLAGVRFSHAWGGPLGIPRDWHASVGLDPATGLGWAGGYVGDGVGTSNLAGRTLADLVLGRRTELTSLAWVGHRSRHWEPEPLRWIGANAGLRLMSLADGEERLTGRQSLAALAMAPLLGQGHHGTPNPD